MLLDRLLALQLQPELDEEGDCQMQVVDDKADVVHPLDAHGLETTGAVLRSLPTAMRDRRTTRRHTRR